MEVRLIKNEDFMQLAELVVDMYHHINTDINPFQALNTLVHMINNKPGFVAIGLFDETALAGFVIGYEDTKKTFHFSGIYVIIKNNEWSKKIIDFSFAHIKELGYTSWTADATNDNISSILEKYGAEVKYKRYYKEL